MPGEEEPNVSVSVLGHRVERREDPPLLTGAAEYLADLHAEGMLHAVFVRSTIAHGELRSVDVSSARVQPGVVEVFCAADLGLGDIPEWPRLDGPPRAELGRPCLAKDRVRFVGEAVAVVVAESVAAAVDAAEHVIVDVDPLPVVVDPLAALEEGAPPLFPAFGSNVVLEAPATDEDVLEGADVVVRGRFVNQRVAPAPIETNAALVTPTPEGGLDCVVTTQAPFAVRQGIAGALGIEPTSVRVRTVAVGGGFGAKGGVYPEQVVVAALAACLGRPVRHVETRSENLVAMSHGRGQVQDVALGARRDGTIVGLEAKTVTDMGAYPWRGGIPFRTARLMTNGVYRIPRLSITSLGVVTNTTPIGPYRGAGRPEATAMLERAMDLLAVELGVDPAELRRRNMLAPSDFPYTTPTGAVYDSGDYGRALEAVLELGDYDAIRKEQAERRNRGDAVALGVGLSTFVEISGSGWEFGGVSVDEDGTIAVVTGASPHGQGLVTALGQVVGGVLGVDPDHVRVVHSDTGAVARGIGTFGSRSGQLAGNAAFAAARAVVDQAREVASGLLEVAPADVVVVDGGVAVAGVPATALSWAQVAAAAPGGRLHAEGDFTQEQGTYPFGAHLAVVEVDTETGRVLLRRLVAVDDCGTVINPTIVEGQVHGGLAQGIAQALFEEVRYDEWGNPLTATFADYGLPSAAELPSFELGSTETPSPRNPLGLKGVGESGTVGSAVAVQNAVVDALQPFGVRHLDMPLSAERVWRAVHDRAPGSPDRL